MGQGLEQLLLVLVQAFQGVLEDLTSIRMIPFSRILFSKVPMVFPGLGV